MNNVSSAYPDTSFLLNLYLPQSFTETAFHWHEQEESPIPVTDLLLYEAENTIRKQAWLRQKDARKGIATMTALLALGRMEGDLEAGTLKMMPYDWPAILQRARQLSHVHAWHGGYGAFDVLHISTALYLGCTRFWTFDEQQRRLANLVGMETPTP